jgi:hypothetical protein
VVHQADMVVGIGVPRPVYLKQALGLAALGVAIGAASPLPRVSALVSGSE